MKEKSKRKRGHSLWKLNLGLFISFLFLALIVSPFLYGSLAPKAYATEAWEHPLAICSTNWYILGVGRDLETHLLGNLPNLNLPLVFESIDRAGSQVECPDGNEHNELSIRFLVDAGVLENYEMLGNFVAELIPVIEGANYQNLSIIHLGFRHPEMEMRGWRIRYSEALRAVAAGLRGAELWAIGQ